MPLFSIPLSGLNADANALEVVSNNLANLNTVGYKAQRASFRDLFYQQIGSSAAGGSIELGAGTELGGVSTLFTGGSISTTGAPTDVAIGGQGFFVTQDNSGVTAFTRAGNFAINTAGQLTTQDGALVMGYAAVNGVVGQTLGALQMGQGATSAPSATTSASLQANLNAAAAVGDTFSTPLSVYDSLGASHVLTYNFAKTGANTWSYQITVPAADVGGTGSPVVVSSGNLTFDSTGKLTAPAGNVTGITVNNLANGAAPLTLQWNLYDSSGNPTFTQFAAPSAASTSQQNGYGSGNLLNFSIGSDGTIQGNFSNGQTAVIGQLALANFANEQGLQHAGGNSFLWTLSSGAPVIGAPGSGGRGTVSGGALETSNVDIAQEFSQMIIDQRGYEANAKVVTTFDQVTQDTINMKQG